MTAQIQALTNTITTLSKANAAAVKENKNPNNGGGGGGGGSSSGGSGSRNPGCGGGNRDDGAVVPMEITFMDNGGNILVYVNS
jgi:hypothetical protein